MKLEYYHNLDGVRGIAALMVVLFHFFTYPNSNHAPNIELYQKLTEFGQHGVSLFFVLSGFVITRILINSRERNNYFRSFYTKRVLRILPLYYFFLFIYYWVTPQITDGYDGGFKLHLPFYFYLQNFTHVFNFKAAGPGHYWSLAVEEHFYLLWPLAVFLISPKNIWKAILISIILVLILKYFMLKKDIPINYFTFTRIDQILMGAYLAVLEWEKFFTSKNSLRKMIILGILTLCISLVIYISSKYYPLIFDLTKYLILGAFFFSMIGILISLNKDHFINKILSGFILQYLGRISYGIYVWHVLALLILNRFFLVQNILIDILLTFGLTILLAHLSFFYFETFFLKLKDHKISFRNFKLSLILNEKDI